MSLDRRVREALEREAEDVQPDLARHLDATIARAGRGDRPSPVGLLAGAAVAIVLVAVISRFPFGPLDDGIGARSPSPSPSTSASTDPRVVGVWTTTLAANLPPVDGLHFGGTWTLVLAIDGRVSLTAPTGFEGSRPVGHAWSVSGDRLTTDLWYNDYCDAIAAYRWTRDADGLHLAGPDDPCAIRRTLLATQAWTLEP